MDSPKTEIAAVIDNEDDAPGAPPFPDMVWVPGGTFRMGSDNHYPEEQPVHLVTVDGFWMDRLPVTNRRFERFVTETSHRTYAEIPPKPRFASVCAQLLPPLSARCALPGTG